MLKSIVHYLVPLIIITCTSAQAQLYFDIETGAAFKGPYNNIRIPGNSGTEFDAFSSDFKTDPIWFYRLRAGYTIKERHAITVLFAPLSIKSNWIGGNNRNILFQNNLFNTQDGLNVLFKFNSYRLTYRYYIINKTHLLFGLGLTGKVRDAAIKLSNNNTIAEKTDLGVVGLINFYFRYTSPAKIGILFEGDAFALPPITPGRAIDTFLGLTYGFNEHIGIKAGYRVLEGGADVAETYNYTWINYLSAGLLINL